jgi:WD40 repeat protein
METASKYIWCLFGFSGLTLAGGCSSADNSAKLKNQNKYKVTSLIPRRKRDVNESAALYQTSWPKGQTFQVRSMAFSPNGKFLASAGTRTGRGLRPALQIFDTQNANLIRTISGHPIQELVFSPDNSRLVSGGPKIKVWNHVTGQLRTVLPTAATSLAISPDGKWLATADSARNTVGIWDVRTWKLKHQAGFTTEVGTLIFSPDSKTVLSSTDLGLDVSNGRVLRKPVGVHHGSYFLGSYHDGVALSPDNALVAEWQHTSEGRGLQLQVQSTRTDNTLWEHTFTIPPATTVGLLDAGLAFSPDSRFLAASNFSEKTSEKPHEPLVNLWNAQTGQLEATVPRDSATDPLSSSIIVFSADNKMLAVGGIGVGYAFKLVKLH